MRIGHYGITLWLPGGVANYVRRIARAQRAAGHEIFFFDRPGEPDVAAEWQARAVGSDGELYAAARAARLDVLHLHSTVSRLPPADLRVIRSVHTHEPYCVSSLQYWKRSERPCPHVYAAASCLRGHVVEHCGSLRPRKLIGTWRTFRNERRVLPSMRALAVSRFMMQRLVDAGYPAEQIRLLRPIPPPSSRRTEPPRDGVPHFVFLGRLVPEKGVQWLLRAWKRLDRSAQLDIAGAGYYEADLKALAQHLGLEERVRFHGWLDEAAASALVSAARGVIVPSLWQEPSGTVVFEAMAHGRAPIISDVGGAVEPVVPGVSALIVPPGDDERMAEALRILTDDHAAAAAIGARAHDRLTESFGVEEHMQQLYRHYDEVVAC
jgi:glycosyltransferase involved in cell wall biosynthesis